MGILLTNAFRTRRARLEPLLLFEVIDLRDGDEGHDGEAREVAETPV